MKALTKATTGKLLMMRSDTCEKSELGEKVGHFCEWE